MYARIFLLIIMILTACSQPREAQAQQVLLDFFSNLEQGNYASAQELYGGSYEILVEMNPDLDPDDHVTLLQNACQVNGFQCLDVRVVTFNELTSKGEYIFTVEFENPDGSLFELGACCGETPTTSPQFQFEYRVVESDEGTFLVLDLPVYVP